MWKEHMSTTSFIPNEVGEPYLEDVFALKFFLVLILDEESLFTVLS